MSDVWVAGLDDVEEGLLIAASRYPNMDVESSRSWAIHYMENHQVSIMRTKNVVSMVAYSTVFWRPRELVANVVFFAGRVGTPAWEAVKLLQAQVRRSKERGCVEFLRGSVTGLDLGPFARRLGFEVSGPNYRRSL